MDTLIVIVIVAVAAWYVVRKFVVKKGGSCGCGCSGGDGSCGGGGSGPAKPSCCEPGKRL
jgi:hypothetical protein